MEGNQQNHPLLTALILGGWATVYCIAVVLALQDTFPVLTRFIPLAEVSLIFGTISTAKIYIVQIFCR